VVLTLFVVVSGNGLRVILSWSTFLISVPVFW
jgi:hypothetical protein